MREWAALHQSVTEELRREAAALRDAGKGRTISFSSKVFIPLTRLCSNKCGYCGYRVEPGDLAEDLYLPPEEVLAIARAGEEAGATEALLVTGERPESRYPAAARRLRDFACSSTPEYAAKVCRLILEETHLLPHSNCGLLEAEELKALAEVNASLGLMLESSSRGLCSSGQPHGQSPAKLPAKRLAVIEEAGRLRIPFTTGILIGIGESDEDRIESLVQLSRLQARFGHIQEVIIQNFRAQNGTGMAGIPGPSLDELLWTIAVARIILGPTMNIQAPPNLALELGGPEALGAVLGAGINDWGGISAVTDDVVNMGAKWPSLTALREETRAAGFALRQRFPLYPEIVLGHGLNVSALVRGRVEALADREGFVRQAEDGEPVLGCAARVPTGGGGVRRAAVPATLSRVVAGMDLNEEEIIELFSAEGPEVRDLLAVADELRSQTVGNLGTYVVNRNINFTNICFKRCRFCGFSRNARDEEAFQLSLDEVLEQVRQADRLGATEVCIQAGLSAELPPAFYLQLFAAIKRETPAMHIHGVSPEEVDYSSRLMRLGIQEYLGQLQEAGLGSMPGTSAEILDDGIRRAISPRRISTARWLEIIQTAHRLGIQTSATMMYGHVETFGHRARHLLLLRSLQEKTGGFTEFVPLRFVGQLRGRGRQALPQAEEEILKTHAIARIVLGRSMRNIQVSWVKEGVGVARRCLRGGANDLGGTLMNESISSSAGARNGELLRPRELQAAIRQAGMVPAERSTLYKIREVFEEDALCPPHPLDLVDETELRTR